MVSDRRSCLAFAMLTARRTIRYGDDDNGGDGDDTHNDGDEDEDVYYYYYKNNQLLRLPRLQITITTRAQ